MRRILLASLAAGLMTGLIAGPAALAAPARVAVFPFALKDTSLEGEVGGLDPAETARLAMITTEVESRLSARGIDVVDLTGHAADIADLQAPWDCFGCEVTIARAEGADVSLTGFVHKVSTLIQSISIIAYDTETGKMLGNASVSIRGNTDEAWKRGVDYILKKGLLGEKVTAALE